MTRNDVRKCNVCGEGAEGQDALQLEPAFMFPDDVAGVMWEGDPAGRAKGTLEACSLDGRRFFLRGLVPLVVLDRPEPYSLGMWAEVDESAYRAVQAEDRRPYPFRGKLANTFPGEPSAYAVECEVEIAQDQARRPDFRLIGPEDHVMVQDQRKGITVERALEYLKCSLERPSEAPACQ
jgi:hypothetical protein